MIVSEYISNVYFVQIDDMLLCEHVIARNQSYNVFRTQDIQLMRFYNIFGQNYINFVKT